MIRYDMRGSRNELSNECLTCKQQYDKTQEETEMNFLINASYFACMEPGFYQWAVVVWTLRHEQPISGE